MRWRAERWMKVRHLPAALAHDPGFVLRHGLEDAAPHVPGHRRSRRGSASRANATRSGATRPSAGRSASSFRTCQRATGCLLGVRTGTARPPYREPAELPAQLPPRISARLTLIRTRIVTDYEAYLFGEGHWLRAWEKMGARPAEVDGVAGLHASSSGRRTRAASRSSATSTSGTAARIRCAASARAASGRRSCPGLPTGALYKFEIQPRHGPPFVEGRSVRACAPSCRRGRRRSRRDLGRHAWRDDGVDGRRGASAAPRSIAPMAIYEVHAGIVAPEAGRGQSPADLARAGRRARAVRAADWASRTSS